jgi:hypothetical protein
MKFRTILAVCLIAMVVVASAVEVKTHNVQQTKTLLDTFLDVVNSTVASLSAIAETVANAVNTYVIQPAVELTNTYIITPATGFIAQAQAAVNSYVVGPATTLVLQTALSTFCSSFVQT